MERRATRRSGRGKGICPDYVVGRVLDLTPEDVRSLAPGVRAICLDIDGTVTDYHAPAVAPPARERLASYVEAGFATFIVSNCYGARVDEVHRLFDPLVTRVVTPADCVDPSDPSDRPTRHRKPKPDMLLTLAAGHEVEDAGARRPLRPDELLMVGDQILKDVLTARLAGSAAVLVPREGPSDHLGVRILQRPLERALRVVLRLPVGRRSWPDRLTAA
ncbi:MAG: HAD hydrolase-like protein [Actinomycetes bacterium]